MRLRGPWLFFLSALVVVSGISTMARADMAPEYHPRGKAKLSVELIEACEGGLGEEARRLLKRGASPTWQKPDEYQTGAFDMSNGPAWLTAIRAKKVDVLRVLLDERPQLIQTLGQKMLHEVLYGPSFRHEAASDEQFLKLLIERKIDVNPPGDTPLMSAARDGKLNAVQLLVAVGADASRKDEKGLTALAQAKAVKSPKPEHAQIIKLLEPITK